MALLTLKFVTDVRDLDYEVVEFHGELDQSTLAITEQQIFDFLAGFQRTALIFDLRDLAFINSEGIGFIVSTYMKLVKKNQQLILCGFKSHVGEVLQLIGLPKLIPVFSHITQAIDFIKKKK